MTEFFAETVRYLREGLRNGDGPMRWSLTVAHRTKLVDLVIQVSFKKMFGGLRESDLEI